jgi:formate dehydrogenase maturation protein FdhE
LTRNELLELANAFYTGGFTEREIAFARVIAAAEREGIAQMFEDAPPLVQFAQNDRGGCMVCGFTPKLAIDAIRARGNT